MPDPKRLHQTLIDKKEGLNTSCPKCGKMVRNERPGSMTSWIFAPVTCRCRIEAAPGAEGAAVPGAQKATASDRSRTLERTLISAETRRRLELQAAASKNFLPSLPQYDVLGRLGEGGMGIVYAVQDRARGEVYAIKILREEIVTDKTSLRRFEQEANATAELMHTNIGQVFGSAFDEAGAPYLLMEYVEGVPLSQMLESGGSLIPARALNIFMQVGEALQHAHQKGVVHRDLKPSNILITRGDGIHDGVKIVDFGIAKLQRQSHLNELTQQGEIFGSPFYMSPEQCTGATADERSDIYSMGCAFYHALSGDVLFSGENPIKIMMSHLNKPIMDHLKKLQSQGISANLVAVLKRMLEKDPKSRYQNMHEILVDLKRVKNGKPPASLAKKRFAIVLLAVGCILFSAGAVYLTSNWTKLQPQMKMLAQNISAKSTAPVEIKASAPLPPVAKTNITEISTSADYANNLATKYLLAHKNDETIKLAQPCADGCLGAFDSNTTTSELHLLMTDIEGSGFNHLVHLPLKILDLANSSVFGDVGMPYVSKMTGLVVLNLDYTAITDGGLSYLPVGLTALSMQHTLITDKGLHNLLALKHLKNLNLGGCSKIAGPEFEVLSGLKSLEKLSLWRVDITDGEIHNLLDQKPFPKMKAIALGGKYLTDKGFDELRNLPKLEKLSLGGSHLSPVELRKLAGWLPSLESLSLDDYHTIDDSYLAEFRNFKSLTSLDLENSSTTDEGLLKLGALNLKSLNLARTNITDKGLMALTGLKHLESLDLTYARKVTVAGAAEFQNKMPKCHLIHYRGTKDDYPGMNSNRYYLP